MQDFFKALFDFSFQDFITKRLISVLYGIGVGVLGLISLFIILSNFTLGNLVGGLLFFTIATIILRIWLEVITILFAIEENTRKLTNLKDSKTIEQDERQQQ